MNRLLTIKEISNWGPKITIYLFSGLNITLLEKKKIIVTEGWTDNWVG